MGPLLTFATAAGIALHTNGGLTISKIFTSFSIIMLLNGPLAKIIIALPQMAGAFTSFQRIQDHLTVSERKDVRLAPGKDRNDLENTETLTLRSESEKTAAEDSDLDVIASISGKFSWPKEVIPATPETSPGNSGTQTPEEATSEPEDEPVIDIFPRLDVPRRSLTLIIGPVGCGKSTLLKALLGELSAFEGTIKTQISGAVTFCDQNPWLPNETVREIICGKSILEVSDDQNEDEKKNSMDDEEWYQTVISACELERDMQVWPRGDRTPVGSKGISMSGGQKQRLVSDCLKKGMRMRTNHLL